MANPVVYLPSSNIFLYSLSSGSSKLTICIYLNVIFRSILELSNTLRLTSHLSISALKICLSLISKESDNYLKTKFHLNFNFSFHFKSLWFHFIFSSIFSLWLLTSYEYFSVSVLYNCRLCSSVFTKSTINSIIFSRIFLLPADSFTSIFSNSHFPQSTSSLLVCWSL